MLSLTQYTQSIITSTCNRYEVINILLFFDINVWGLGSILHILYVPIWTSHISSIATCTGQHESVGE